MMLYRFPYKFLVFIVLSALLLGACSSPTASVTDAPAAVAAIESTATTLPLTPTRQPPTSTAVPPTMTLAPTPSPTMAGEGELRVLASLIQVERGFLSWVDDFSAQTGCEVTLEDFVDYENATALIAKGGVDVVVAGMSSSRLAEDGLVAPIDVSRLTDWETVDPSIKLAPGNSVGEEVYGVPYLWIPNVLMYNTEVFPTPPTSWSVVFEEQDLPDGKSNKQRIWAPFEANYIADAAMYLNANYPWADIPYPFEITVEQLFPVMDVLQKQYTILSAYYDKYSTVEDFDSASFAAAASIPYLVNMLREAGYPVSSTIPDEGATTLAFTNMLVKDAPHSVCAYKWMEYSLDAKVQGDTAAQFGANPAVSAACEGASQLLSAEDCERNGVYRFSEFYVQQTPLSECSDGRQECTSVGDWVDAFNKLINP